jgi:Flp pilus assembly pilin Flp
MRDQHGQALVEYLLTIAVISVIAFGIIKLVGGYVKDTITKSSCELLGQTYVAGEAPGESRCEE